MSAPSKARKGRRRRERPFEAIEAKRLRRAGLDRAAIAASLRPPTGFEVDPGSDGSVR